MALFKQICLGAPTCCVHGLSAYFTKIVVDWLGPLWIAALPCMAVLHCPRSRHLGLGGLVLRDFAASGLPTLLALLLFDGPSDSSSIFAVGIPGLGYGDNP